MAINYPEYKFEEPFCSTGEKTLPPINQTSAGNGRTSLKTGFPPECQKPISAGGLPPERTDFNGILNALSQWVAWLGVGGSVKFDPDVTYPEGATIYYNKRRWMCVKESISNIPSVGSEYWEQLEEATGTIKLFGTDKTPAGYLPCDGRAVTKTEYPDLFAVIGTRWGGSGNYFNVPDLRNRFPMGATSGVGQFVPAGLPSLTGAFNAAYKAFSGTNYASGAFRSDSLYSTQIRGTDTGDDWGSTYSFDASRVSSIYGKSSTVQPPAVKVGYFIRY